MKLCKSIMFNENIDPNVLFFKCWMYYYLYYEVTNWTWVVDKCLKMRESLFRPPLTARFWQTWASFKQLLNSSQFSSFTTYRCNQWEKSATLYSPYPIPEICFPTPLLVTNKANTVKKASPNTSKNVTKR